MRSASENFLDSAQAYINRLGGCFNAGNLAGIEQLSSDLMRVWAEQGNVFICGNGGSAANAVHMANDFHYGIGACGLGPKLPGLRVEALPANMAILTCLGNDTGYENIYAHQIEVKANQSDILIVLSGSGNSSNVVNAIKVAKSLGMKTHAIVAFDGGLCKKLVDNAIHFEINDMQVAEDTQLIAGHMCMQWLNNHKPKEMECLKNG